MVIVIHSWKLLVFIKHLKNAGCTYDVETDEEFVYIVVTSECSRCLMDLINVAECDVENLRIRNNEKLI